MASIEEKVEDCFKQILTRLNVRHYAKTEAINPFIEEALSRYESKSGGEGNNYPDIKCLLDDGKGRCIPVMMEAKGGKKKLEKTDSNNAIIEYTKDGSHYIASYIRAMKKVVIADVVKYKDEVIAKTRSLVSAT